MFYDVMHGVYTCAVFLQVNALKDQLDQEVRRRQAYVSQMLHTVK